MSPPVARGSALLGYVLVVASVSLAALNAVVAKVIIHSGQLSVERFSQARSLGTALLLLGFLLAARRPSLRLHRREVLVVVLFGVCGIALAQLFSFAAIARLEVGIALVIVYLAPVLVAAWRHFVVHERVASRLWVALALSLVGLSLAVELWGGIGTMNRLGVAAAFVAAVAFAVYVLAADRGLAHGRDVVSLLAWGFVFATFVWAIVEPWWAFPGGLVTEDASLLGRLEGVSAPVWSLLALSVVFGAFALVFFLTAFRHLSPTRVVIIATLEPVLGGVAAFAWLDERLSTQQLVGAVFVLTASVVAQTARPAVGRDPMPMQPR